MKHTRSLIFINNFVAFAHLSVDDFCQTLIDTLEGTPGMRYIWSTFRPLLRGKVLYAPDTPAARLLVKEVGLGGKNKYICYAAHVYVLFLHKIKSFGKLLPISDLITWAENSIYTKDLCKIELQPQFRSLEVGLCGKVKYWYS